MKPKVKGIGIGLQVGWEKYFCVKQFEMCNSKAEKGSLLPE